MADTVSAPGPSHANANGMRSEIAGKWSKLSATDIAGLKSTDELVSMVQTKYSLERNQAQKDVDTFAKGRSL
jgi:hypothetical protein